MLNRKLSQLNIVFNIEFFENSITITVHGFRAKDKLFTHFRCAHAPNHH
jgi:hypothetical protein